MVPHPRQPAILVLQIDEKAGESRSGWGVRLKIEIDDLEWKFSWGQKIKGWDHKTNSFESLELDSNEKRYNQATYAVGNSRVIRRWARGQKEEGSDLNVYRKLAR